jgi:hypothetical protein
MKRRIKASIYMCMVMALITLQVFFASMIVKATPIDTSKPTSLTVHYCEEALGKQIKIYRICSVEENGTYSVVSPFDSYPVNVYGITSQAEWKTIASTLSSYIIADSITPTYETLAKENGEAVFENIQSGMYLVMGINVESEEKSLIYETFITLTPYPNENGDHLYDVEAYPKSETVTPEKESHKIIKQWKDNGFSEKRPDSVTVDIYKDGVFNNTVTLNTGNNWSYKWDSETGHIWTAVERNIDEKYTVTIEKNEETIIITNVYNGEEPPPVKPGDNGNIYYFIIIMFLSGMALIALSKARFLKQSD